MCRYMQCQRPASRVSVINADDDKLPRSSVRQEESVFWEAGSLHTAAGLGEDPIIIWQTKFLLVINLILSQPSPAQPSPCSPAQPPPLRYLTLLFIDFVLPPIKTSPETLL